MKFKPKDENAEVIFLFIEDIMSYLENKEDKECKKNQKHAGIQELFRGCIVSDWEGTNLKCKNMQT